jgi:hypothetical protein
MATPTSQERRGKATAPIDFDAKVAQLQHLLAAHEAAQALKRELAALAAESPAFWEEVLSEAEHISTQVRMVIHDTGEVITGTVPPA